MRRFLLAALLLSLAGSILLVTSRPAFVQTIKTTAQLLAEWTPCASRGLPPYCIPVDATADVIVSSLRIDGSNATPGALGGLLSSAGTAPQIALGSWTFPAVSDSSGRVYSPGNPPLPAAPQTTGQVLFALSPSASQAHYPNTGVNIVDFGTTKACSGANASDTEDLNLALASNVSVFLPPGTCNFNTTPYMVIAWPHNTAGTGYDVDDNVTLNNGGKVKIYSVTLNGVSKNSGGTGYTQGDVITLVGGNNVDAPARITVNTVSGPGAILTYTVNTPNYYLHVLPTTFTSIGGTGSGATWNTPVWGPGQTTVLVNSTTSQAALTGQASTTGSGSGATFDVVYAAVVLSTTGQRIIGSARSGTVIKSTASGNVVVAMTGDGTGVEGVQFALGGMSDGCAIYINGAIHPSITDVRWSNYPCAVAMTNYGQVYIDNFRQQSGSGGTESIFNPISGNNKATFFGFCAPSAACASAYIQNGTTGLGGNGGGNYLVFDGYVSTTHTTHLAINLPSGSCVRLQNSYDSSSNPNFFDGYDTQCQTPGSSVAGFSFASGTAIKLLDNFCNAAAAACVFAGPAVSDLEMTNNRMNGAAGPIFDINTSNQVVIDSGLLSNSGTSCSAYSNKCPIVGIRNTTAGNVTVANSTITASAAGYGIEIASGGDIGVTLNGNHIFNNALGRWHDDGTQDCSGITVVEDGLCAQEGLVTVSGNFNLTAAQMTNSLNGGMKELYMTGSGGAFTATTPSAASILAALQGGGAPGQQWLFLVDNEVGATATLAGGANVTINGPATIPNNTFRKFNCVVNAGGTAIACRGQANTNS